MCGKKPGREFDIGFGYLLGEGWWGFAGMAESYPPAI